MKRLFLQYSGVIVFVLLVSTSFGNAETITISSGSVNLSFNTEGAISNTLSVKLENFPSLPNNVKVKLVFSPSVIKTLSTNINLTFTQNLFTAFNGYSVILDDGTTNFTLISHVIPTGVLVHVRHVYSNWTFGQPPPPDGRGLGVGAMIDSQNLVKAIPSSVNSVSEGSSFGEGLVNLVLGKTVDYNQDSKVTTFSDNWGFASYLYGMRDHIFNAGKSTDASASTLTLAESINQNFTEIIPSGNLGSFLSNINTSTTLLAKLYRDGIDLLESKSVSNQTTIVSNVTTVSSQLQTKLTGLFNIFRTHVISNNVIISKSFNFTLSTGTPTSAKASSNSPVPLEGMIIIIALPIIAYLGKKQKII